MRRRADGALSAETIRLRYFVDTNVLGIIATRTHPLRIGYLSLIAAEELDDRTPSISTIVADEVEAGLSTLDADGPTAQQLAAAMRAVLNAFDHMDVRRGEWLPVPRRISSVATDQLAIIHQDYFEGWQKNAKIASESLMLNFQIEDRNRVVRERIYTMPSPTAFLYGAYLLRTCNVHLRQPRVAALLADIQALPMLPERWKHELPVRFLVTEDMEMVESELARAPARTREFVHLGFSYGSIFNGIHFLGTAVTLEQMRTVLCCNS